jgi:hypothetical protein
MDTHINLKKKYVGAADQTLVIAQSKRKEKQEKRLQPIYMCVYGMNCA